LPHAGTFFIDCQLIPINPTSSGGPPPAAAAAACGQVLTLPVHFQQQQQQGGGSSGLSAANVRVVDGRRVWSDPHNLLLLAQAGASCQVCALETAWF
jgi:hypothetical protein